MNKWILRYRQLPIQMKASFWFLICNFLQRGISVISTPVFTRILSTADYGKISVFNSWLGIISVIVTLNLGSGVYVQALVKFDEDREKYASSMQGLTLTLIVIWTVVYVLFHRFWNVLFSLTTFQMLAMLALVWTSAVFGFWSTMQRVDFKYRFLVFVTIIVAIMEPVLEIIFIYQAKDKVTAKILGRVMVYVIIYTWFFFVQMRKGKIFYSKVFWKYGLLFNLPLIPHYLSSTVLSSMDRIMISNMVGTDSAGIYSLAYSISQIMTIFNAALQMTMEPWLYKKLKEKQPEDIKKIAYPSFLAIAAANIILIALAPEAVAIFAPGAYYEAIWVIPPIAMSVFFTFAYSFFAAFEFYYEKQAYVTIATSIGAVLNIVLNSFGIQMFGYIAAGYTTLFCYISYTAFHYYFMQKICKQYLDNRQPYSANVLMGIAVGFMTISFLFLCTYHMPIIRYSLLMGLIVAAFIKRQVLINLLRKTISIRTRKEEDR